MWISVKYLIFFMCTLSMVTAGEKALYRPKARFGFEDFNFQSLRTKFCKHFCGVSDPPMGRPSKTLHLCSVKCGIGSATTQKLPTIVTGAGNSTAPMTGSARPSTPAGVTPSVPSRVSPAGGTLPAPTTGASAATPSTVSTAPVGGGLPPPVGGTVPISTGGTPFTLGGGAASAPATGPASAPLVAVDPVSQPDEPDTLPVPVQMPPAMSTER